jgi:hypothetical protein
VFDVKNILCHPADAFSSSLYSFSPRQRTALLSLIDPTILSLSPLQLAACSARLPPNTMS